MTHIVLAISLFLPAFLLPFTLRPHGGEVEEGQGRVSRALLWLQRNGTLIIGAGVALTGVLADPHPRHALLGQPWLLLALAHLRDDPAAGILHPAARAAPTAGPAPGRERGDKERWRTRARRQRYVSYVMAGAIGLIGWLDDDQARVLRHLATHDTATA